MLIQVQKLTRPSKDIPWFKPSDEYLAAIKTYENDGKLLKRLVEYQDEGQLTVQREMHWRSEADFHAQQANPLTIAYIADRNAYDAANGITFEYKRKIINDQYDQVA
jgi:hypothetical protein